MAILMIGYDLNRPGQDYADLISAIKVYGTWWHHLDSTWLIETADSPAQVRNNLKPYLDENDELLVAAISAPAAWTGFKKSGSDWLLEYL